MDVIIVMNVSQLVCLKTEKCCSEMHDVIVYVKRMVTCQTYGHMSNVWSHVKRMVTCQTHGHVTALISGHMSNAWSRDRRKW